MRVAQISADLLLSEIERVLQSYEEFVVDQSLEIEVVQVNLPSGKDIKRNFTLIFKSHWKENTDSLRLSTGIIYAVQEPLSRPKLDIFDKHLKWNSIRKVRTCVTHGTLFWRKKWPIVLHIWCVSDMSIRLYTICS